MSRSFSLVDSKVAETEFFLKKIDESERRMFDFKCYLSAFVSSSRSITFSLQSVLKNTEGFEVWYTKHQTKMKNDPLARFFNEFRRINQHIGENVANRGTFGVNGPYLYWFVPSQEIKAVPELDVSSACKEYFISVLELVYDCYRIFGTTIDAHQRYTSSYFLTIGKTIEDAEVEAGFIAGWTDIGKPEFEEYRWQMVRDQMPGCEINEIFYQYLNKITHAPERLPPFELKPT